jgi:hypothetical protein
MNLPDRRSRTVDRPSPEPNQVTSMQGNESASAGVAGRYLDGSYSSSNPDWHASDAEWKAGHIASMLARHGLTPSSICDVGCGTGGTLRALAKVFPSARLHGFEPGVLPAGAAMPTAAVTIDDRDLRTMGDHWDLMLMIDVFEHVEDYLGFLRSYVGLADRAIFHIPLDLSVQSVLRSNPILHTRQSVGHLHYFSRETALATLHDTGYSIVDSVLTAGGVEGPSLGRKQQLAAVPRRAAARVNQQLAARLLGGFSLLVLAKGR